MKNIRFAIRLLKRNPLFLYITIPALALGLAIVLLLLVYIRYEWSYDNHFSTSNRVLRLYAKIEEGNQVENTPICLRDAYVQIPGLVPEAEACAQIYYGGNVFVEEQKHRYTDMRVLFVDPEFFTVFGQRLVFGDVNNALKGENQVVISESVAKRIFRQTDCVGRLLEVSNLENPLQVTGVIADLPQNTHFQFDLLVSMATIQPEDFGGLEFFTYFLIGEDSNLKHAGDKIAKANDEIMIPWIETKETKVTSATEELRKLHFSGKSDFDLSPQVNQDGILIVGGLALFILAIALVNYISLYVLHAEKRLVEISVRKTLGAGMQELCRLVFAETAVIGLLAFSLALVFVVFLLPWFADLMHSNMLVADVFSASGVMIILGVLVLSLLLSGTYPLLYLFRIPVIEGLKDGNFHTHRKKWLMIASVVFQFTITTFLITCLVVFYAQIRFLKSQPLGFQPQKVYCYSGLSKKMKQSHQAIQNDLLKFSYVESTGASFHRMGGGVSGQLIAVYGHTGKMHSIDEYRVLPGFCNALGIELVAGRYFTDSESDKEAVILNQAAVRMLGVDNPLNTLVDIQGKPMKVIGVTRDFAAYDHTGFRVLPLMLTNYLDRVENIYVKVSSSLDRARRDEIQAVLRQYDPDYIEKLYSVENLYDSKYNEEQRIFRLVGGGTVLAIVMSFMGLLALSLIQVNQRTKEIGLRKIHGCSEPGILVLLLKDTLLWVALALLLASLLSAYAMGQVLTIYASRLPLHIGYFLLSSGLALGVAVAAIGWQSWRAASRNPVESLRYE